MYRRATIAALSVAVFAGADWRRFRGPEGSGVSSDSPVATTWNADENVVWKTPLPGFGTSSPITLGDKIFLTCYSGYALDSQEPGDQRKLLLHVLCLDRATGKIIWDETNDPELPETEYDSGRVNLHGYASSTAVTDGEAVYVFFGKSGVFKYGLDGKVLWRRNVGSRIDKRNWGSATSPILYGDLVIVNASIESESVRALSKETGKEVWRIDDVVDSWSTPLVVELPDGSEELVVSRHSQVIGIDPETGKRLWKCASVLDYVCPSVVAHEGVVYITGGRRPLTVAVRAGGRGDVTDTHLIWDLPKCSKVPTPLVQDGLLYWVCNKGIAVCVDAATGEVRYEERLDLSGAGDKVYASVVAADGKIYAVSRESGTVVLAAGPKFKVLARNRLDDGSVFNATPVVSDGQLLLRSDNALYCIGK